MLRASAGPADILRADRHKHAELRGDDIEPLDPVLEMAGRGIRAERGGKRAGASRSTSTAR